MSDLPLHSVPSGTYLFLDANIFIYGLTKNSKECIHLLDRCMREDVFGITTVHILCEVTHRLMMFEANSCGIKNPSDLKKLPNEVKKLQQYWNQTEQILKMNLLILSTEHGLLPKAHIVRCSHGLLTNDSLSIATMQEYGMTCIASRDDDFKSISGLICYSPTDINCSPA